ncbi:MAG: hypothetical protein DRQ44_18305 [Gammaproteobacteria bacterium]|nr:MAG: hypothetical protein DRQ44_18305 [Gammaproteobacteria bacterium]
MDSKSASTGGVLLRIPRSYAAIGLDVLGSGEIVIFNNSMYLISYTYHPQSYKSPNPVDSGNFLKLFV